MANSIGCEEALEVHDVCIEDIRTSSTISAGSEQLNDSAPAVERSLVQLEAINAELDLRTAGLNLGVEGQHAVDPPEHVGLVLKCCED